MRISQGKSKALLLQRFCKQILLLRKLVCWTQFFPLVPTALTAIVVGRYLNGKLNVARALGDFHMEGLKTINRQTGPLIANPEFKTMELTKEDEFLIIGCYGICDVFRSQNAIDSARRRLQEHNDPATCRKDLVDESLKEEE